MIAVETVIRKLIGEYEFVIIPGFGALLSHQVPASFDKNAGFFTPPVKKLAFNEYLKLDDGLLANYISREEKWSHAEAVEYVRSYTEKLRSGLEMNGMASIAGIGAFNKNVEGKLVFEPNTGKYFKDEWYGFGKVKARELSSKPVAPTSNVGYVKEEEVEIIELEEHTRKPLKWIRWAAAAMLTGLLCGLSFFLVNSSEREIRSTLNPFTELFTNKGEKEEVKKVSSPEPKTDLIAKQAPIVENPATVADSLKNDSATSTVPVETAPKVLPATKPTIAAVAINESRFYVIAGAFKGTRQAKVLLAELKTKGFKEASILPGDKFSKKVKVAVDGFDNETDAYRASAKLKQVIGEEGWVFKKR